MRSRTITALAFFILCVGWAVAQSPPPVRKFKHRGKIETKYDKFKNQTTISLKPYYIQGTAPKLDPTAGLEIYSAFVYSGQTLSKRPDTILLGLVSTSDKAFLYEQNRGLIAIVDGERADLGPMDRVDASYKKKAIMIPNQYYVETLAVSLPYEVFQKLANAKTVEMQIGQREFKLREEHLEALRDILSRLTP